MSVYCRNCGAQIGEGARFCEKCGSDLRIPSPEMVKPIRQKERWVGPLVISIVVIVGLIMLAILLSILSEEESNPLEPARSGELELTIYNDDWFASRDYSVYIDGDYAASGNVDPLSTAHRNLDVLWHGDSTHLCTVDVYSEGDKHTETTWITDGMSASIAMTL